MKRQPYRKQYLDRALRITELNDELKLEEKKYQDILKKLAYQNQRVIKVRNQIIRHVNKFAKEI